jgi:hypothetical protein
MAAAETAISREGVLSAVLLRKLLFANFSVWSNEFARLPQAGGSESLVPVP